MTSGCDIFLKINDAFQGHVLQELRPRSRGCIRGKSRILLPLLCQIGCSCTTLSKQSCDPGLRIAFIIIRPSNRTICSIVSERISSIQSELQEKKGAGRDLPADSLARLVQRSLAGRPTEADDVRVPKDGVHVRLEPQFSLGI